MRARSGSASSVLCLGESGPLRVDNYALSRRESVGQRRHRGHLGAGVTAAIDEVIDQPIAADVEGRVSEQFPFEYVPKPDTGTGRDENVGE
jgi:hypothetical protein